MLRAALRSAWSPNPQARQQNSAWDLRLAASVWPHDEHRRLVSRGFTRISSRPASSALYATIPMRPPHAAARMSRLRPAVRATLDPGSRRRPRDEAVVLAVHRLP